MFLMGGEFLEELLTHRRDTALSTTINLVLAADISTPLFRRMLQLSGGLIIPDKETAKALNDLARHTAIVRILSDIRMDLEICEIEGWDKMEYINKLKQLLNSTGIKMEEENGKG